MPLVFFAILASPLAILLPIGLRMGKANRQRWARAPNA
jgi:hypothetical protein